MLPLTRNIFRQTATSFNNTTKRWKQESYYIQIKWWSAAVCELLKNLHLSIKNDNVKINNYGFLWMTSLKKIKRDTFGQRFSTYVANDAVFVRQKVHLEFCFSSF